MPKKASALPAAASRALAPAMEVMLARRMLLVAKAFAEARKLALTSVGVYAANDRRFFVTLEAGKLDYRVRTYDRVMKYFRTNWPANGTWPPSIPVAPPIPQEEPRDQKTRSKGQVEGGAKGPQKGQKPTGRKGDRAGRRRPAASKGR